MPLWITGFVVQGTERQKPDAEFKGTYNLITRGISSDEPRLFGVPCDPTKFSETMEIPAGVLSPKYPDYETHMSIDVSEPGLQPLLMGGSEKILSQRIFDDCAEWRALGDLSGGRPNRRKSHRRDSD